MSIQWCHQNKIFLITAPHGSAKCHLPVKSLFLPESRIQIWKPLTMQKQVAAQIQDLMSWPPTHSLIQKLWATKFWVVFWNYKFLKLFPKFLKNGSSDWVMSEELLIATIHQRSINQLLNSPQLTWKFRSLSVHCCGSMVHFSSFTFIRVVSSHFQRSSSGKPTVCYLPSIKGQTGKVSDKPLNILDHSL